MDPKIRDLKLRRKGKKGFLDTENLMKNFYLTTRFWMYLELFAAVIVSWIIDLMAVFPRESVTTAIISDLIICLTVVTIFTIFVIKKDIRCLLFKRYQSFNEIIPEARQI